MLLSMRARVSLLLVVATAVLGVATGCGARTGLADSSNVTDAGLGGDLDAAHDTGLPIVCPPIPIRWSPSRVVVGAPSSVAMAAHPRCGVVVASSDASNRIDVATLDPTGAIVHAPLDVSGQVVAIAQTGTELHVLYNDGAALRYVVRRDGALGASELVDPDGLGKGDLIVDAAGAVHAVYVSATGPLDELRYVVRRGAWALPERVEARQAFEPTIALGKDSAVHVSYEYVSSSSDHGCVLATGGPAGSTWSTLDLPRVDAHWSSSPCNLRASADGTLHVAYGAYGAEGPVMLHAFGDTGALRFETLDRLSSFGTDPKAAAVDARGRLHAAYRSAESGAPSMMAVTAGGTTPSLEKIPDAAPAAAVIVVVDGVDVTHVIYFRDGSLWYTARAPS